MPAKKKETKAVQAPQASEADEIIRDLLAIIQSIDPNRPFSAVAKAERYLAAREPKKEMSLRYDE